LFETKRDQKKLRKEGVAGRTLWATKELIDEAAGDPNLASVFVKTTGIPR
jgi:hypothetical protein